MIAAGVGIHGRSGRTLLRGLEFSFHLLADA